MFSLVCHSERVEKPLALSRCHSERSANASERESRNPYRKLDYCGVIPRSPPGDEEPAFPTCITRGVMLSGRPLPALMHEILDAGGIVNFVKDRKQA